MPRGPVLTSTVMRKSTDLFCSRGPTGGGKKKKKEEGATRAEWRKTKEKRNSCVFLEREKHKEIWLIKRSLNSDSKKCDSASWHSLHKRTRAWNSSKIEIFCRMFHTWGRKRRGKSTKFSLLSIQPFFFFLARSESIYTSFWKLISSSLSMVKTDFQTQSPQQSIFPWQRKSVGAGSLGYERRNISISLFNSLWHPAYVSLGTVWDIVNRRQGCARKGNGGMKSPELANRLREKKKI